jgi:hypothetical protein
MQPNIEPSFYITDPSSNLEKKPYDTLEQATTAASIKLGGGVCKEVKIYKCTLARSVIMKVEVVDVFANEKISEKVE